MQPSSRDAADRGSQGDDQAREYKPSVQAIVDAVRSSRRFKSHPQSIPEESATSEHKTESNFASPEIEASEFPRRSDWRMLSERHRRVGRRGKRVTPVERRRRLEDMRDREDVAAYNNSRLVARLEILDTFIDTALTDDMFMGRQELNPWRFRRNENLQRKWQFVHNAMVTQELLDVIHTAKARKAEDDERRSQADVEKRSSPDGQSFSSQMKETPSFSQSRTAFSSHAASKENLLDSPSLKFDLPKQDSFKNMDLSNVENNTSEQVTKTYVDLEASEQTSTRTCADKDTLQQIVEVSITENNSSCNTECEKTESGQFLQQKEGKDKPTKIAPCKIKKELKTVVKPMSQKLPRPKVLQSSKSALSAARKKNNERLSVFPEPPKPLPAIITMPNHGAGKAPKAELTSESSSTSCLSAVVIHGFGSHHRRDTCDYCGRYKCPGMRNRGRKRNNKQNGPGGYLDERKNDMEGIYESSHKASERFQERLVRRMNQLGLK